MGNLRKLELYAEQAISQWCKYPPWSKQEQFLKLDCIEAFFGGAAGGGKSDALLRDPLQYVHLKGYAALILRTSATDLRLSGGLIERSYDWIGDKAHWNGNDNRWTFPSGASIQFGYLSAPKDKFRYRSSEFQYIGFDELTDFTEEDYLFMFSRLRQRIDIGAPEKIRAASNPGGPGHGWVKERFITKQLEKDFLSGDLKPFYRQKIEYEDGTTDWRYTIPSKIRDNPAIDPVKYMKKLVHLTPVMRERMMNGDWSVMPTGLIKAEWLRYYTMRDKMVDLLVSRMDHNSKNILHTNEVLHSYHEDEEFTFITIDPAGGVEDIEKEAKGKPLSYTAIGHWGYRSFGNNRALRLKRVRREKGLSYSDMKKMVREEVRLAGETRTYVENKAMGMALVSDLGSEFRIEAISSGIKDKVARNAPFTDMMCKGEVYLPKHDNSWRLPFESELLSWQGLKEETNDQIDIAGYAAIVAGGFSGGVVRMEIDPRKDTDSLLQALGSDVGNGLHGGGYMKWS